MKVTQYIKSELKKIPEGEVFTYERFLREKEEKEAVIKALNRKVQAGGLAKLSRGRYYKPENTVFGTLQPAQEEVVKDLIWEGGKQVGYLTGLSIYHDLGLTTQIGNTVQIGKNDIRPAFKRGRYKITFVRQKNPITQANIPLLQLLDTLRYLKKIPDTPIPAAIIRLKSILKKMSRKETHDLIDLAARYPPSTRSLLGAILQSNGAPTAMLEPLKKSLNPITTYSLKGAGEVLDTALDWNIT